MAPSRDPEPGSHDDHHRWESEAYVAGWLARDLTRDGERRGVLRHVLDLLPERVRDPGPDRVLDVGGGYGLFAGVVLEAFPAARVVLHDFSEPMLARAAAHLAGAADRVALHRGDLHDDAWHRGLTGPFDLVVSALALHNLRSHDAIRRVYADVAGLVAPGGCFLTVDLVAPATVAAPAGQGDQHRRGFVTVGEQLSWLRTAGFAASDCLWKDGPQAALVGLAGPVPGAPGGAAGRGAA